MRTIKFTPSKEEPDGVSASAMAYTDPDSGRRFVVRVINGPLPHERDDGPEEDPQPRFFLYEWIPTGRVFHSQLDEIVDAVAVPPKEWAKACHTPSRAVPLVLDLLRKNPGFWADIQPHSYTCRSLLYGDLDECLQVVENALDADVWLCSEEPLRTYSLGPRMDVEFEAMQRIDSLPGGEAILSLVRKAGAQLAHDETLLLCAQSTTMALHVFRTNPSSPGDSRLCVFIDSFGKALREGGFFRGRWGGIIKSLAGVQLADYDGPAGRSGGAVPRFGQIITSGSPRPPNVSYCIVLEAAKGRFNDIYCHCVVDGQHYWARGKRLAGAFRAVKVPENSDPHCPIAGRTRRGEMPINPDLVPHFWDRLMEAIASPLQMKLTHSFF